MSNETASTLTLIGGILNILFAFGFIAVGVLIMLPFLAIPFVALIAGGFFAIIGIIGIIFGVIPLMWRSNPGNHRVGLIILGILSLGTIGGLLFLIAGIIAEEKGA
ncbi:MAG: hypothetical protein ACFFDP_05445 [Promethearchaeota archaeon]